jgi:hypothetical protein
MHLYNAKMKIKLRDSGFTPESGKGFSISKTTGALMPERKQTEKDTFTKAISNITICVTGKIPSVVGL